MTGYPVPSSNIPSKLRDRRRGGWRWCDLERWHQRACSRDSQMRWPRSHSWDVARHGGRRMVFLVEKTHEKWHGWCMDGVPLFLLKETSISSADHLPWSHGFTSRVYVSLCGIQGTFMVFQRINLLGVYPSTRNWDVVWSWLLNKCGFSTV